MTNLRAVGHLLLNLMDSIEERGLTMEHQTIGIGNVLEHLLIGAVILTHGGIHTAILHMIGAYDARGHILREGGACLNHCGTTNTGLGILDDRRREDGTILDDTVACNLGTIAKDTAVSNLGVVRDMGTLHQDILIAQNGLTASVGGAVDDHVLANDVMVANDALRLLATEVEVLWQCADDSTLVHLVMTAHARAVEDTHKGEDDTVVTNHHVVLDIHEGEYLTVVANLRLWANLSFWTNFTHNTSPDPSQGGEYLTGFRGTIRLFNVINEYFVSHRSPSSPWGRSGEVF